jgi:hypothetical protein
MDGEYPERSAKRRRCSPFAVTDNPERNGLGPSRRRGSDSPSPIHAGYYVHSALNSFARALQPWSDEPSDDGFARVGPLEDSMVSSRSSDVRSGASPVAGSPAGSAQKPPSEFNSCSCDSDSASVDDMVETLCFGMVSANSKF